MLMLLQVDLCECTY